MNERTNLRTTIRHFKGRKKNILRDCAQVPQNRIKDPESIQIMGNGERHKDHTQIRENHENLIPLNYDQSKYITKYK